MKKPHRAQSADSHLQILEIRSREMRQVILESHGAFHPSSTSPRHKAVGTAHVCPTSMAVIAIGQATVIPHTACNAGMATPDSPSSGSLLSNNLCLQTGTRPGPLHPATCGPTVQDPRSRTESCRVYSASGDSGSHQHTQALNPNQSLSPHGSQVPQTFWLLVAIQVQKQQRKGAA